MAQTQPPHPLILNLAVQSGERDVESALEKRAQIPEEAVQLAAAALDQAIEASAAEGGNAQAKADREQALKDDDAANAARYGAALGQAKQAQDAREREVLADFGVRAGSPEIRAFSGFLGGRIEDTRQAVNCYWQVLFLDANLRSWIMVDEDDILYSDRVEDSRAPNGLLDYIWVEADARIAPGDPTTAPGAFFLSGNFTRAGDFKSSVRGDTYSPSTGLACEALTPGGCGSKSFQPR